MYKDLYDKHPGVEGQVRGFLASVSRDQVLPTQGDFLFAEARTGTKQPYLAVQVGRQCTYEVKRARVCAGEGSHASEGVCAGVCGGAGVCTGMYLHVWVQVQVYIQGQVCVQVQWAFRYRWAYRRGCEQHTQGCLWLSCQSHPHLLHPFISGDG